MNTKRRTAQKIVFIKRSMGMLDSLMELYTRDPKEPQYGLWTTPLARGIILWAREVLTYSPYTSDRDIWASITYTYSKLKRLNQR